MPYLQTNWILCGKDSIYLSCLVLAIGLRLTDAESPLSCASHVWHVWLWTILQVPSGFQELMKELPHQTVTYSYKMTGQPSVVYKARKYRLENNLKNCKINLLPEIISYSKSCLYDLNCIPTLNWSQFTSLFLLALHLTMIIQQVISFTLVIAF